MLFGERLLFFQGPFIGNANTEPCLFWDKVTIPDELLYRPVVPLDLDEVCRRT